MDGYVTIGTELDTKEFDAQMRHIETKMLDIEDKLKQADMGFEVGDTEKLEAEYERLGNQLLGLKEKQEKYNQSIREAQMAGFNKIKDSVDGVGASIQNVTKKIGKMALAVFGICSAFMFVRNAINTIAGDDEQLKADIDYMKSAIAYTLEPVVRGIVDLAKQLMFYVGYIVKALTGKNIFANANKSLKNATGSAKALNKELSKTTASFDEINVLQDTSSSSASGGTSGSVTPSFDLSAPDNIEPPEWLKWIVDHKDEIIATLVGIATAIGLINTGLSTTKAIGIGITIGGLLYAIKKLIDFLNDPTFNNFIGILQGISVAIIGIGITIGSLPVAIAGAIALIVLLIVQNFDKIMSLFNGLISWLDKNVLGALKKLFGPVGNLLYIPIKWFVETAKGAFEGFFGGIKRVIEGVVKIFKGDFFGGIKDIFGGLLSVMLAPLRGFLSGAWAIIQQIYGFFRDLGGKVGEVVGGAFKTVINGVLGAIETVLNSPIRAVNRLIGVINKVPGINLGKLATFRLPRLARGGIVNLPGKGVPIGGALAGEVSREGVIPLTDSQQMSLLGEAIGKYVRIDNVIDVNMDSRRINRILQSSNNRVALASNR